MRRCEPPLPILVDRTAEGKRGRRRGRILRIYPEKGRGTDVVGGIRLADDEAAWEQVLAVAVGEPGIVDQDVGERRGGVRNIGRAGECGEQLPDLAVDRLRIVIRVELIVRDLGLVA